MPDYLAGINTVGELPEMGYPTANVKTGWLVCNRGSNDEMESVSHLVVKVVQIPIPEDLMKSGLRNHSLRTRYQQLIGHINTNRPTSDH